MSTGILEVKGTIELGQFWPKGTSDTDTTKIFIPAAQNAFRFRKSETDPWKTTNAFEGATVVGKTREAAIDKDRKLTVRF